DFDAYKLAEDWMKKHGAEMVTNMADEQIETIRQILEESVYHKMSVEETARYLRPIIGLTEPQAQANIRYYNNFKTQLAAAHPRMKTESIERKAREAAEKYAVKQRRVRAETIAKTELITAYHKGNDLAVREGIRTGKLPKMKKVWSTSRDDKVCKACMALEGTEIDMDEEFKAKSRKRMISTLIPPLHPRCACAVKYVESDQKHDIMSLPRYEEAVIPEAKFTKYALDPDGDTNKARAFKEALGYDLTNYQDLIQNIRNNLSNSEAKPKGNNGYGMMYEIVMDIKGPNGKTAKVLTGWINDEKNEEMRLTTVHIDKR
ncbi:MAG TPA: phage head morphogenesis protein, partial [Candidatus Blautia faecavium]|nr:phage head morphogenesis protein [Candidatus Blautia faecavium]